MRRILLSLTLLSILSSQTPCRAAEPLSPAHMPSYGAWRSALIGGGGWIQNVVFSSDPQRLYAYVDIGGFYRSDDGGATWHVMQAGLPTGQGANCVRGLSVDPRNPDDVLVAVGDHEAPERLGLYRSTDGGKTLTRTLTACFSGNCDLRWAGVVLVHDPRTPGRVFAASMGDGLFRSDDGGATWRPAAKNSAGLNFVGLTLDRRDSNTLWACAQPFDYNWNGKDVHLGGGFWRSQDGGDSWTKLSAEWPVEVVQAPGSSKRVWGVFNRGLRVRASDDGGVTWADAAAGLEVRKDLNSNDDQPASDRFFAIAAGPDFTVLAATNRDIRVWRDGASAWTAVPLKSVDYRGWTIAQRKDIPRMFAQMPGSISIDPRQPSHWFMTDAFAIYETRDAGATWSLALEGVEATVVHTLCQDPGDPGRVHLGMADNGGFRSEDGGVSFQIRQLCSNVKDFAVSPTLPARVYATGTGGWEWRSNQVFVSIDAGVNWTRSPMAGLPDMAKYSCNTIAVDPSDPYTCMLTVSGELKPDGGGPYLSTDGGKSWRWIGAGLPVGAAGSKFFPDNIWIPGRQLALGAKGVAACCGLGKLYVLDTAANQWVDTGVGGVGTVLAEPGQPGTWLACGDAGVFRYAPDKKSARICELGSNQLAADVAVPGRLAVATAKGVLLSTDRGATWNALDTALPLKSPASPLAFAGERLVVGAGGFGAYWIPLSAPGRAPVAAKAVAAAPARTGAQSPVLRNLAFKPGDNGFDAWKSAGKATFSRKNPTALAIKLAGPNTDANLFQEFTPTFDEFAVSGHVATDASTEAIIAVQVFDAEWKQIAWLTVVDLKPGAEPLDYRTPLSLPAKAAHSALVVMAKGGGEASFGALDIAATPAVFR